MIGTQNGLILYDNSGIWKFLYVASLPIAIGRITTSNEITIDVVICFVIYLLFVFRFYKGNIVFVELCRKSRLCSVKGGKSIIVRKKDAFDESLLTIQGILLIAIGYQLTDLVTCLDLILSLLIVNVLWLEYQSNCAIRHVECITEKYENSTTGYKTKQQFLSKVRMKVSIKGIANKWKFNNVLFVSLLVLTRLLPYDQYLWVALALLFLNSIVDFIINLNVYENKQPKDLIG